MDEANAAEPSHPMRLRIGVNAGGIVIKAEQSLGSGNNRGIQASRKGQGS
jgi:hypothetical protein